MHTKQYAGRIETIIQCEVSDNGNQIICYNNTEQMTDQIYKCNMKKLLFAVTLSTFSVAVMGQQVYELTAPAKVKSDIFRSPEAGRLKALQEAVSM